MNNYRKLKLGRVWAAAEAALPDGWCDLALYHFDETEMHTSNSYGAKSISPDGREVYGYGETPTAALLNLIPQLMKERQL